MGSERIEEIGEVNIKEAELLHEINEGATISEIQHVFSVTGKAELDKIIEPLLEIEEKEPVLRTLFAMDKTGKSKAMRMKADGYIVLYHEIMDLPLKDQMHYINQTITMERQYVYMPARRFMLKLRVFEVNVERYVCILSYANCISNFIDLSSLLDSLFNKRIRRSFNESKHKEILKSKAMEHFRKSLEPLPVCSKVENGDKTANFYEEIFIIDEDALAKVNSSQLMNQGNMAAISFCLWSKILYAIDGRSTMLIAEKRPNHLLDLIPYKIEINEKSLSGLLTNIKTQMIESREFDACEFADVERVVHSKLTDYIKLIQSFPESLDAITGLIDGSDKSVYRIDPARNYYAPLNVNYELYGEKPAIILKCDLRYFNSVSIKSLYETYIEQLKNILNSTEKKDNEEIVIRQGENINEAEANTEIVNAIKNCPIFEEVDEELINDIAVDSELISARVGAELIGANTTVSNLYIISDGSVSMDYVTSKKVVTPILMLKQSEVFGTECLTTYRLSNNIYEPLSENTKLVAIPVNIIEDAIAREPKIGAAILSTVHARMDKLMKLWTMQ